VGNKKGCSPLKGKIGVALFCFDRVYDGDQPSKMISRWKVHWFDKKLHEEFSVKSRAYPANWLEVLVP